MGSRGHTSEVKSRKSYLAQHAISNRLKNGSASSSSRWFSSTEPYSPPNILCKGHTFTIKYPAQNSNLEQLVLAAVEALQLLGGGGQLGDLGL